MTLSIIILNYKTKGLLRQCLRGIHDAKVSLDHEIIVVDNNSGDGSVEMVRQEFPTIRLLTSKNNGCAAGMNVGAAVATGDYMLFLNTDVAVFSSAVEQLVTFGNEQPRAGLIAPKLINPDGSTQWSCYQFPTPWTPIFRRTPIGKLPGARQHLRRYLMLDWPHDLARKVDWVLGACMLIRRTAWQAIGPFDDRYFLYFEDVDFCRRLWQNTWEVWYVPSVDMVHYHKRESAANAGVVGLFSFPTNIHIQSAWKYFRKFGHQPLPTKTI